MSTRPPSRRTARGRVVIVGDDGQQQRLGHGLSRKVIGAETLFDAVGEVTIASSAEPVAAVVAPLEIVESCAGNPIEAFRRIDPSIRLILIAATEAQLRGAGVETNGFDAVLVEPLAGDDLERVVSDADWTDYQQSADGNDALAPRVNLETKTAQDPQDDAAVADGVVAALGHVVAEDVLSELPLPVPEMATVPLSDAPDSDLSASTDGEPCETETLGDTDLVEAVLSEPDGVLETALRLIRQQTCWTDLRLTAEASSGDAQASAVVAEGEHRFGAIASRQADADQLQPWADWLARWLTLDRRYRDFRLMSFRDDLTGAWNRRFFNAFMEETLRQAAAKRRAITIMVFDLDDFKRYNDEFGHQAGDEILCETVRLLNSVIRKEDRVCRMGGDEFVVVFADLEGSREPGSAPPETVEAIAKRFQRQICQTKFPKLGLDAPGTLSISGGLATYPWDGADAAALLRRADQLALESKRKGKNVLTIGPGAQQVCEGLISPPEPDRPTG
ncbi:MAG: GGDEF domain-containing protein [Planctomycetes bacterium]|nr:GGDEF domain-containing protein [Planctomycetota bacterium]